MAGKAGEAHRAYEAHPQKKKHRRRRKKRVCLRVFACLILPILLIVIGALSWKGIQLLRGGFEDMLKFFTPVAPNVSALPSAPTQSTIADRDAPTLSGVHDFTVYQGDTISYLSGITATDDVDANPTISVDTSAVDLSNAGEYTVTYSAADASGNVCNASATVTVLPKEEGYVDLDTIYSTVDAKLQEILRENATVTQQVHDIYAWARCNLSYGGHSERSDWRQTAYGMLTEGRGDCFGYYAVTKLMFERLEIPNIDVQKVKNSSNDSDHFWSLVSTDGGETWYHFDATPRYGSGDDFCLVTDAFLDAYSDAHKGSHNRDKSLYPATP